MIIDIDAPLSFPRPAPTPMPVRSGDYLDTLLEDLCYEVIRREGIHVHLTGEAWEREAAMLAARLRPLVIDYIAQHND